MLGFSAVAQFSITEYGSHPRGVPDFVAINLHAKHDEIVALDAKHQETIALHAKHDEIIELDAQHQETINLHAKHEEVIGLDA